MNYKSLSAVLTILVIILAGAAAFEATITTAGRVSTTTVTSFITSSGSTSTSKRLLPITYVHSVDNQSNGLPFYIAEDLGIFKEEGVDAKGVILPGDTGTTALLAGNAQISLNGDPILIPALKGANITLLEYHVIGPTYGWIVARSGITSVGQLNGKLIASERPGSATYIWAQQVFSYYRINVTQVPFDSPSLRQAALLAGKVDAAIVTANFLPRLTNLGYNVVISAGGPIANYPSEYIGTTPSALKSNPQAIFGFLKAMVRAIVMIQTQPDVVMPVIMRHYNLTAPEARVFYDQTLPSYTLDNSIKPVADRAVVLVQLNRISNPVPVTKIVDFSLLNKILQSAS